MFSWPTLLSSHAVQPNTVVFLYCTLYHCLRSAAVEINVNNRSAGTLRRVQYRVKSVERCYCNLDAGQMQGGYDAKKGDAFGRVI